MNGLRQYGFLKQLSQLALPGENLFVSGEYQAVPTKPVLLEDWPWEHRRASFRSLLQREVLFDFDNPTWDGVVAEVLKVEQRLQAVGCPYYMYNSAGKGWHINVYLDSDDTHHIASYKQLRLKFWEWAINMGAQADFAKVNWGSFTVVRAEGALRRAKPENFEDYFAFRSVTKALQEYVSVEKPKPTQEAYPEHLATFKLPISFLLTLDNENGLGMCNQCSVPWSALSVSYDDWDNHTESLTCAVCRSRQHLLLRRYPLQGEWKAAMPLDLLP